ncbi:hypothetical protein [Methylomicrobium sp. Wu6]|uniref:hypothetical protein n=1 Tax=Methylomicrobium sp. Wu6 TaxID=3107928 RepID=UPI002DD65EF6|nr:hypothetical protein [Methylomicrobium sp. Wu6]MEC4747888.1 hypothetical protein [Methylomicrobium sp. Wu6]
MRNDLEQKHDDELWAMWGNYITAAGRIKKEIDRRQRITTYKLRVYNVEKRNQTPPKEA